MDGSAKAGADPSTFHAERHTALLPHEHIPNKLGQNGKKAEAKEKEQPCKASRVRSKLFSLHLSSFSGSLCSFIATRATMALNSSSEATDFTRNRERLAFRTQS